MEPKVILSTAWAEHRNFGDEDLLRFLGIDLTGLQVCSEMFSCPRCGNEPSDSLYQFFRYEPVTTPDTVEALKFFGCVCGQVYCLGSTVKRHHFDREATDRLVEGRKLVDEGTERTTQPITDADRERCGDLARRLCAAWVSDNLYLRRIDHARKTYVPDDRPVGDFWITLAKIVDAHMSKEKDAMLRGRPSDPEAGEGREGRND